MSAPLDTLVHQAHGHAGRELGTSPMRRVVVRMDRADVARIDALRARFPKTSRAALVRALCLMGLAATEQAPTVPEVTP